VASDGAGEGEEGAVDVPAGGEGAGSTREKDSLVQAVTRRRPAATPALTPYRNMYRT
jgi:hypothetical protein